VCTMKQERAVKVHKVTVGTKCRHCGTFRAGCVILFDDVFRQLTCTYVLRMGIAGTSKSSESIAGYKILSTSF
jgi:hypothetical protein